MPKQRHTVIGIAWCNLCFAVLPTAGSTGPSPRFVVTQDVGFVEHWAGFLFPCYPNRLDCELQVPLLCVFAVISEVDQGFMTGATESIDIV
jgi:hypothetical protein